MKTQLSTVENDAVKHFVKEISKDEIVVAVLLFGSYAKKPEYARDIDLCVVFDSSLDRIQMGRKRVEMLGKVPEQLDIQVFQLLPLYVRKQILAEGKILFLRNEQQMYDLAYQTIREFELFEHRYNEYIGVEA